MRVSNLLAPRTCLGFDLLGSSVGAGTNIVEQVSELQDLHGSNTRIRAAFKPTKEFLSMTDCLSCCCRWLILLLIIIVRFLCFAFVLYVVIVL